MAIINDIGATNPTKLLSDIREIEYRQLQSVLRIERVIIGVCAVLMTLICAAVGLWLYWGLY